MADLFDLFGWFVRQGWEQIARRDHSFKHGQVKTKNIVERLYTTGEPTRSGGC